jgi:hypothetical protein
MQGKGSATPERNISRPQAPPPRPAVKEKVMEEAAPKTVQPQVPEEPVQQAREETVVEAKAEEKIEEPEKPVIEEPAAPQAVQEVISQKEAEESVAEAVTPPPTKEVRKHWDEFIGYVMDRKKWMAHTLPHPASLL